MVCRDDCWQGRCYHRPSGSRLLIWTTSPIVGTDLPSAGRFSVCAISPLTDLWGESNSGGFFGPELRFAGFDGLEILGRSEAPVWLLLRDGVAELRDATDLMGLTTYQTQNAIREQLGDSRVLTPRVCSWSRISFVPT